VFSTQSVIAIGALKKSHNIHFERISNLHQCPD
jgi:hypothetical protein